MKKNPPPSPRAARSFSRNKAARGEMRSKTGPRTEGATPRRDAPERTPYAATADGARGGSRSGKAGPAKAGGFSKTRFAKADSGKTGGSKTVGGDRPWSKHRPTDVAAKRDGNPTGRRPFDKTFKPRGTRPDRAAAPARETVREPRREAFRTAPNAVLMWGLHAARAAWLNPDRRITRAWLTEAGAKAFAATRTEVRDDLLLKRPDPATADRETLDRMLPASSVHQGIVIETMPLAEPDLNTIIAADPPPSLILLLDQVTDPHNVGAILRSAAAFGAGAVVLTERNAPTATGVMAKSASGALDAIPLTHVVNLSRTLDELREAGYWCVGLAEEGEKYLGELDLSGRTVLVLGNEGEGLRHLTRQKCDELAKLPTGGPIGSLNVSNAAAVALYEMRRQAK